LNPDFRRDEMKRFFTIGIVGMWLVFLLISVAYPEEEKGALLKKESQAEGAADSTQYVIGPEDVLSIHVWREEALSKTVPVRMDGKISLPIVDEIKAAGLTPLQLREILIEKLKEFIDDPVVSVIVTEANSFKVFVSGQVKAPGVYRLRSETSLIQIIPLVGGFTDWANRQKIVIIRKEDGKEKRIMVNYKKIVNGEDLSSNIILKPGDTIIVP
jgi:polysaccharide biosynthesis/export protein